MAYPYKRVIGIIGGSGVYTMDALQQGQWRTVESPWGEPSDQLCFATLSGQEVVFLPRHGRGHRYSPSTINYRANIDALKRAGCTDIISVSAVGSLKEELPPGTFVIVDQFIDRTFAREKSFFGTGCVAHVSMAHPVSAPLAKALYASCQKLSIPSAAKGTYLVMEGPQFSSLAESQLYRQWGCDVIGMTNMPEAKLAREAEMAYATVAMVTDYDCWHEDHGHVTVEAVIRQLQHNAEDARRLLLDVIPALAAQPMDNSDGCYTALDFALITAPEARDKALLSKLDAVAGRVLDR